MRLLESLTARLKPEPFFQTGRWYIRAEVFKSAPEAWKMTGVRVIDGERQICFTGFRFPGGEGWLPEDVDQSLWCRLSDVEVTDMFLSGEVPQWQSTDPTP